MSLSRRMFIKGGALSVGALGSLGCAVVSANSSRFPSHMGGAGHTGTSQGFGPLIKDERGILDLPRGFTYRVLSRQGSAMSDNHRAPALHDGMGAFPGGAGRVALVRNHELEPEDVEKGLPAASHVKGAVYDHEALAGGTTNLLVDRQARLSHDYVSLAGTVNNCAGGPTPWRTWLTCEEAYSNFGKRHGYVFEVDPLGLGNPEPIKGMGRFKHEAVCFDRHGNAYLTEDDDGPHGCFYRYIPRKPLGGAGSLHGGGELAALAAEGLDTDLSIVQTPGVVLKARWVSVPDPDPGFWGAPVREQAIDRGATPIQKCEGCWTDVDGCVWFVSSRGDGPDTRKEDRSAAKHSGQIWRYDPAAQTIEMVTLFPGGTPYDNPDNIVASPHGFAIACTDGGDDQWLVGITREGQVFPFALNALNKRELAGATFSPDGRTLFANLQGPPGLTVAIRGPWRG